MAVKYRDSKLWWCGARRVAGPGPRAVAGHHPRTKAGWRVAEAVATPWAVRAHQSLTRSSASCMSSESIVIVIVVIFTFTVFIRQVRGPAHQTKCRQRWQDGLPLQAGQRAECLEHHIIGHSPDTN